MYTRYDGEIPIVCPQPGPQELFLSTTADIAFYGGAAYGGKAQPLDAMVCTPFGFKPMSTIKVGSQVSNPDGSVARVIAVWQQGIKKVYKITCDDGASCECTEDHLWLHRVGRKKRKTDNQWTISTTNSISEKVVKDYIIIPLASSVQFTIPNKYKNSVFPIDPYFLGALIGDGCIKRHAVSLTSNDKEIADRIGVQYSRVYNRDPNKETKSYYYKWDDVKCLEKLGLMDKKSEEKFIPEQYKTSSIEYRIELMKGLMDTDGYVDDRGHGSYTTVSKKLAEDVQFVARSLGYTATISTKNPTFTYKGEFKNGMLAYNVWIGGKDVCDIVSLKRKKDRCVARQKTDRSIISVEYVRDAECQCITVDHPNGLYITNDFIVTHNSFALLMEATRNVNDPLYTGKIFRRKYKEIVDGGGLWDTSQAIYPFVGGEGVRGNTEWTYPAGCKIKFDHLNQEKNMFDHQGAAYVFLGFDELTHFLKSQFFYLLSRNRPPAGCYLRPYCRATFNAEPGWIADMIQWYWDPETGYPIKERSGVIRHFIRKKTNNPNDDDILWVSPDYRDENGLAPYSFTFISASADDNPLGLLADPTFKSRMNSLDHVTRERLVGSNFLISFGGNMFRAEWFDIIEPDEVPKDLKRVVRYWDMAASEVKEEDKNDPDWTAGVAGTIYNDVFYILDANFFRKVPGEAEQEMKRTAKVDGNSVEIWWEEEKGSSGKYTSEYFKQIFKGYDCHPDPVSGSKVERAAPWSAWAYNGRVKLVRGAWNKQFISWATQFPDSKRDVIDGASGCFRVLIQPNRVLSYYVADNSEVGNRKLFARDREAFEKITKGNIDVYVVLWSEDNGSIYAGFYIWSHVSKRLRIYNELIDTNPVPALLARRIKELVVVPMNDNPQTVCLKRIYCNDTMVEYGKGSMAKELRKHGIRLHKNSLYDENGAILTANALFSDNSIIVHEDLTETDTHIRGWQYDDNKKPKRGYPLAKCMCLLLSQLKEDKVQLVDHTPKPYSRSKTRIRNELRSQMNIPGNPSNNEDKQHEYLAK